MFLNTREKPNKKHSGRIALPDHTQRHKLRLEKALPICSELGKWIAIEYQNTLPKSALGKAMAYCLARWDNLIGYLHDGALEMEWTPEGGRPRILTVDRSDALTWDWLWK